MVRDGHRDDCCELPDVCGAFGRDLHRDDSRPLVPGDSLNESVVPAVDGETSHRLARASSRRRGGGNLRRRSDLATWPWSELPPLRAVARWHLLLDARAVRPRRTGGTCVGPLGEPQKLY